jgi:hypothetical protein
MVPRNAVLQTGNETTLLLTQSQSNASTDTLSGAAGEAVPSAGLKPWLYHHTVFFIFALSFVADLGGSLVDTPEVRLLEMAVCRDYYLTATHLSLARHRSPMWTKGFASSMRSKLIWPILGL